MRLKNLEYKFYEANVSLPELLTIGAKRLKNIGVDFPYECQRIYLGLMKFHERRFSPESLRTLHWKKRADLETYFNVLSNCLKHLVIVESSLTFVEHHELLRTDEKLSDNALRDRQEIKEILLAVENTSATLLKAMENVRYFIFFI